MSVPSMSNKITFGNIELSSSHVEAEMNHISVLYDVLFALQLEFSLLATLCLAAERQQVVDSDHLGPYDPALDVRMKGAGGLVRVCAAPDRPRAALVFARRQKTDQVQ